MCWHKFLYIFCHLRTIMLIVKCLVGLEKILSTGIFNTIQHKKYKIFETTWATLEISLPSKLLITSSFSKDLKVSNFSKVSNFWMVYVMLSKFIWEYMNLIREAPIHLNEETSVLCFLVIKKNILKSSCIMFMNFIPGFLIAVV